MRRRFLAVVAVLALAGCTSTDPRSDSSEQSAASAPSSHAGASAPSASASSPTAPSRLRVSRLPWRLPGPLAREAVMTDGGSRVVVAGGLLAGDSSSAATYDLDVVTGRVRSLHDLTTGVHDTAGVRLGSAELVIGGGNAAEQAVVQARSGRRWRVVGRLPGARSDLSAVTVGDTTYVVGGYDGTSPALAQVLATRDGRHWRTLTRLPVPVRYAAVVVQGGAIWVLGGEVSGHMVDAVQRIDLHSAQARVVAHLPEPLGHATAAVLRGRLLLAGGRTTQSALTRRMWWFDPVHRTFSRAGRLPSRLADSAVVTVAGSAYLLGGETPAFSDRVLRLRYR